MSIRQVTVLFFFLMASHTASAGDVWGTAGHISAGFSLNLPSVPISPLPGVEIIIFDIDIDINNSTNYDVVEVQLFGAGPGNLQPVIKGFAIADGDVLPASIAVLERVPGFDQVVQFRFDTFLAAGSNSAHLALVVPEGVVVPDLGFTPVIRLFPVGENFAGFASPGAAKLPHVETDEIPYATELTSGIQAELSQGFRVPSSAFTVEFDYAFLTATGIVEVSISGVNIGMLEPTNGANSEFQHASFIIDGALLASVQSPNDTLSKIELSINGEQGSRVLLDNIQLPDVLNGGFDTGTFFGWETLAVGLAAVNIVVPDFGGAPTDTDNDGIDDDIDGTVNGVFDDQSAIFSSDFTDQHLGGTTHGSIIVRGDNMSTVTDDSVGGVLLSSSGIGFSMIEMCGPSNIDKFNVPLVDEKEVVVTCGSLTAEVITGPITLTVGVNVEITIPTGAKAFMEQLPGSLVSVGNVGEPGAPDIVVEVDGIPNNVSTDDAPFMTIVEVLLDADSDGVPDVDDNCPVNPNPGQEDGNGDGVGDACQVACDTDLNGVIDRTDIRAVLMARNSAITPVDPRDPDGNGVVTMVDARQCVLMCTLPGCASP